MQHQQLAVGHIATAEKLTSSSRAAALGRQIKDVGVVGTHALLRRFKAKDVHKTSFLTEEEAMTGRRFQDIWKDQCEAARGVREQHGVVSALEYLIGEKLMTYAETAVRRTEFARELPRTEAS